MSFLKSYGDDDLVVVMLGDHQPATIVSGDDAGHDVPVSVIARDPAVLARIDGWGWDHGLHPSPEAQVWRMDLFRDRFLTAYGAARLIADDRRRDAHAAAARGARCGAVALHCLGLVGNDRARAEDVVQETMLRAWRHRAVLDTPRPPAAARGCSPSHATS